MIYDPKTFTLTSTGNLFRNFIAIGVVLLAFSVPGFINDPQQFYFSYLTSWIYWFTIGIGAFFFILLSNLIGSVWTVVLRRLGEIIAITLPALIVLFVPILFGMHDLYHWTHEDAVATDTFLQHKEPYLDTVFFAIRAVFYFAVWFTLTWYLYKKSTQHHGSGKTVDRMRQVSAPGMILFALTLTFASFDWLMSLDPHWYSTIFGVYIFSGSFLVFNAFIILFIQILHKQNILKNSVTIEHLHDVGKLLFTFTVFWAYIAGSQYFLIWYGNIPEETVWFLHRWEGSWKYLSIALITFQFIIPFFILLFRSSKRNLTILKSISILLLFAHWIDIYWIIMPSLHHHGVHFSWMDLSTFGGIGCIYLGFIVRQMQKQPLVPSGDPRLTQSIKFTNQ